VASYILFWRMRAESWDRIVVLKDGGIVEQGSHKELLELNGLFASMWVQQISASEEPSTSKVIAGYDVSEAPVVDIAESEMRSSVVEERMAVESPQVVPASLQTRECEPEASLGVEFPVSDDTAPAVDSGPMAFPTSTSNTPSVHSHPPGQGHAQGASVTFDAGVINTPPRTGTPEPGSGSGSGRKVAQNFQRLARRISLSGKAPKLSNLPGLRRDASMMSTASASRSTPASISAQESGAEDHPERSKEERSKRKKRKSFM